MYASRITVFVFAFVLALVSAAPIRNHHRRSQCKPRTATPTNVDAAVSETPAPSYGHAGAAGSPTATSGPIETSNPESSPSSSPSSPSPSSASPAPSKSSGSGSGGLLGGLLDNLFPVSGVSSSWTTSPSSSDALPLSDATFRPADVLKALTHTYTNAPDGKPAMQAKYAAGSYNFQHEPLGGFSFYASGPENVDISTATEATFSYSVYFPEGFDFVKGGKLPGIYGGNSDSEALSCSGGRRDDGCFSARLMWRTDGAGELYTYLPPSFDENKRVCTVKPQSDCNPTYGASVGRGSFKFATGGWTTVAQRVKLNQPNQADGELELFVNGESVINVNGLVLRNSASGKMRGYQMQTFFGGSSSDFATPKEQTAYFADFSAAKLS